MRKLLVVAMALIASTAQAQWQDADISDDGKTSWVWSDKVSGVNAGYMCSKDSYCTATLRVELECEEDTDTPIMMTFKQDGDRASMHVNARCFFSGDKGSIVQLYYAKDETKAHIENWMRAADSLSVVLPTENGSYVISRFSLKGSASVMKSVESMVGNTLDQPNESGFVSPTQSGNF